MPNNDLSSLPFFIHITSEAAYINSQSRVIEWLSANHHILNQNFIYPISITYTGWDFTHGYMLFESSNGIDYGAKISVYNTGGRCIYIYIMNGNLIFNGYIDYTHY